MKFNQFSEIIYRFVAEDNIALFDKMYEIYTNAKLAVELEKL